MRKAPRWTVAFLRGLERSGMVRSAAKDAGIDFTTAYARRKAHEEFAAAWAEALRAHKERVERERNEEIAAVRARGFEPSAASPAASPTSAASGRGAGAEFTMCSGQVRRVNAKRWTKAAEALFFATLAETANVQMAADACGFSTNALYARRLRHPLFAETWAAAVDTARMRVDLGLIEVAQDSLARLMAGVPGRPPQLSVAEALHVLRIGAQPHVPTSPDGRRRLNGGAQANVRVATNQEIAEALKKRLAAFSKRIERERRAPPR
jgi:hypothetical protein